MARSAAKLGEIPKDVLELLIGNLVMAYIGIVSFMGVALLQLDEDVEILFVCRHTVMIAT